MHLLKRLSAMLNGGNHQLLIVDGSSNQSRSGHWEMVIFVLVSERLGAA